MSPTSPEPSHDKARRDLIWRVQSIMVAFRTVAWFILSEVRSNERARGAYGPRTPADYEKKPTRSFQVSRVRNRVNERRKNTPGQSLKNEPHTIPRSSYGFPRAQPNLSPGSSQPHWDRPRVPVLPTVVDNETREEERGRSEQSRR